MDVGAIVAVTGGVLLILATLLAGLLWVIKAQIAQSKEMQPNGGSTMRDALNRTERQSLDNADMLNRIHSTQEENWRNVITSIREIRQDHKDFKEEVARGFADNRDRIDSVRLSLTEQGNDIHRAVGSVHERVNAHLDDHLKGRIA